MNKIELLAPAGNLEKLKFAYLYGADACYIGGRDFSLRANAKNFSIEEINEACSYAHNLGKRVYVTVNIVFHNEDIEIVVDKYPFGIALEIENKSKLKTAEETVLFWVKRLL